MGNEPDTPQIWPADRTTFDRWRSGRQGHGVAGKNKTHLPAGEEGVPLELPGLDNNGVAHGWVF